MKQELINKALEQLRKYDKSNDIDDLNKYSSTLIKIADMYGLDADTLNEKMSDIISCEVNLKNYVCPRGDWND